MRFGVLLKKELSEILRTYKIYVVPVIFLAFGLVSPILAKIMPELIRSLAPDIRIEVPTPTWLDAFAQYFKNLTQVGLLAVILTTMGVVADEKSKGTVLLVLSRPVSRYALVFAKFTASVALLAASVGLSFVACLYYTHVLFPDLAWTAASWATLVFFVYAIFIASLAIAASSIARSNVAAGGMAVGGFFLVSLLPSVHRVFARYSPGALNTYAGEILAQVKVPGDAAGAVVTTMVLSLALVTLGSWVFTRQEL
ncbi:MAG: ABC transporter permease [Bacillota bacterium]